MIERPARSSHPSWLEIAEARFQALKVWNTRFALFSSVEKRIRDTVVESRTAPQFS